MSKTTTTTDAVLSQDVQSSAPGRIDLEAGRRAFIRSIGLGIAGTAIFGAAGGVAPAQAQAVTDFDILNFALNLEYLEAEFYLRAATGQGLSAADVTGATTAGPVAGGRQVPFANPNIAKYAVELANDELAHVRSLRNLLGSNRVARPAIDLGFSFTLAARAAGLAGPTDTFDAFSGDVPFLLASFIFEDVGVTAYNGAAGLISNKSYLGAAASILAVEAYHAGAIRTLLYGMGLISQAGAISDARGRLSAAAPGSASFDQGIGDASTVNITPTNADGLAFARSTTAVLNIVYLNGGAAPSGFFPNGLNGTIR